MTIIKEATKVEKPNENESTLNEEKVEEENPKEKKNKKIDKLEADLEKAKADSEHWKNEYYRAYADMKNLRDALQKDHQNAMKYRAEGFIESLLPVLDSFHMALGNEPSDQALKNYLIGFQFIYKNLVSALESERVSEISPNIGDTFDASTMSAVDAIEDKDKKPNTIVKVYSKGYKLHDRLVRPVNVQVSKLPEEKPVETKEENKEKADA